MCTRRLHWRARSPPAITRAEPLRGRSAPRQPARAASWVTDRAIRWQAVAASIAAATGEAFSVERWEEAGGGCINRGFRIAGAAASYFVKLNAAQRSSMFEAEAEGLRAIAATATIRVPQPICTGTDETHSWLVLEQLPLGGTGDMAQLGRQLAQLHRAPARRFGWHRDNIIGSTLQINAWSDDWVAFWRVNRLGFQLDLAARNGFGGQLQQRGAQLAADLDKLFAGHAVG